VLFPLCQSQSHPAALPDLLLLSLQWLSLKRDTHCNLSKFAGDIKLGGAVDLLKERYAIQKDIDRPEDWAHRNPVKINKAK